MTSVFKDAQPPISAMKYEFESSPSFASATASESKVDRAADPEWHKRRPFRRPPHKRCRMEIASTAFDGIQSRSDEHQQKN